jgi:hypothetical protein
VTRAKIRLAGPGDDVSLRALLRKTPMAGRVSLAFCREPSFFEGERPGALATQTICCVDRSDGEIIGFGCRSLRRLYVDGQPETVGYLGGLRLAPHARGGLTLARLYRELRVLHEQDAATRFYVTTILSDNVAAREALESGRGNLPRYRPWGKITTYLVPLSRNRESVAQSDVRRCDRATLTSAHGCLDRWNSRRQFAPVYGPDDLAGGRLCPGFNLGDLYVRERGSAVIGTLGVWDQTPVKQTVIAGYSAGLSLVRPLVNLAARLRGHLGLPPVGQEVRAAHASMVSVEGDDPETFKRLLETARADWSGRGFSYLALGLAEGSPFAAAARRLSARSFQSEVYLVHWPDEEPTFPDGVRPLHLEIATL